MLRLKFAAFAALLALPVLTQSAKAETADLAGFTCGQFMAAGNSNKQDDAKGLAAILFWVAGYHASDTNGTIVDFEQLQTEFEDIAKHCADNPDETVLKVAGNHLGGEEPGSGAVDLATLPCDKVNKTTADKADGLATILMWLAGYQAGFAGDTVFDVEAFSNQVQEIGAYCAANPQIGLYAASEKFMLPAAE